MKSWSEWTDYAEPNDNISMVINKSQYQAIQLDAIDGAQREINLLVQKIRDQRELHTMQLAAISTVSISNTEATLSEVEKCHEDYKTMAFCDVVTAVKREMKLIGENRRLMAAARQACDERYEEEQRATYERSKRK